MVLSQELPLSLPFTLSWPLSLPLVLSLLLSLVLSLVLSLALGLRTFRTPLSLEAWVFATWVLGMPTRSAKRSSSSRLTPANATRRSSSRTGAEVTRWSFNMAFSFTSKFKPGVDPWGRFSGADATCVSGEFKSSVSVSISVFESWKSCKICKVSRLYKV